MEAAVTNIESMKAESQLNYLTLKLDTEHEAREGEGEVKVNVQTVLSQLNDVKAEHSRLVQDVKDIQQMQKETMEAVKNDLSTATQLLQTLQQATGVTSQADTNADGEPSIPNTTPTDLTPPTTQQSEVTPPHSAHTPHVEDTAEWVTRGSDEFTAITEVELQSVPSYIRLHCKLHDVNRVYSRIWQYFREESNTEPLSRKTLHTMGCKVSSASGEATLKTLRALELINLSRSGDITLV